MRVGRPTRIGDSNEWTALALGADHTCALETETMSCWGRNNDGRLGIGTMTVRELVPANVPGAWTALHAGFDFTCARTDAGELRCWGANYTGQLGDGSTTPRAVPTPVFGAPGELFTGLAFHSCALDGDAWHCWGKNTDGQASPGRSGSPVLEPAAVDLPGAVAFEPGRNYSCTIDAAGAIHCWGNNAQQQLGLGDSAGSPVLTPTRVCL
jgi:alpha-tubulin suppressor-like RCC1 family protein